MSADEQVLNSVEGQQVLDHYQQIKALLLEHESDYTKFFEKKNNSAGTRLRRMFLEIKKLCHEGRQKVQSEITQRKEERKAPSDSYAAPSAEAAAPPVEAAPPAVEEPAVEEPAVGVEVKVEKKAKKPKKPSDAKKAVAKKVKKAKK